MQTIHRVLFKAKGREHMYDDQQTSSSTGIGLIIWISTFAASWSLLQTITSSAGFTLVFSVFIALIAFDIGRRSLQLAFVLFLANAFVILLAGTYALLT